MNTRLQEQLDGQIVEWMEKVTRDEQQRLSNRTKKQRISEAIGKRLCFRTKPIVVWSLKAFS